MTPEGKAHGPSKCLIRSHVWYRPHQVIPPGWDVKALLLKIAEQPESQRYSALIDTGALITGLSNIEVATFLLEKGLAWCEGVVFLDEQDRKMVLARATMRVVEMEQCGVPSNKLFALYDQVSCMDI